MKRSLNCKSPRLKRVGGKHVKIRCRQCLECGLLKQQQWVSRLMFEDAFNPYRPMFATLTYEEEPNDIDQVISDVQTWLKRLRQRKYSVRFFATVEKGSLRGRIHAHAILWSDLSLNPSMFHKRDVVTKTWKRGICFLRDLYGGRSGFNYTTKYILKDPIWYTWSRRPGIVTGKH